MDKRELWEKFMSTGKISDYILYARAQGDYDGDAAAEFSEEFTFSEEPDYDFEDGRYRNP